MWRETKPDIMKCYKILPALVLLVLLLASCGRQKAAEGPWKGYWFANVRSECGNDGVDMHMRLDFYGSSVSSGGFENALGVLGLQKEGAGFTPIMADVITSANIINDGEAEIEYVKQSTGELWSGMLFLNSETGQLTFRNGKMLREGASGNSARVVLPGGVTADMLVLDHLSEKPNFKNIRSYELVMELPERTYYMKCRADEMEAPPYGDLQLRCYYPDTDQDVPVLNEVGESPLDPRFRSRIIDCWSLPDGSGIGLIVWRGGDSDQEFTLFRIGEDNKFREVDYVTGARPGRFNDTQPDEDKICVMMCDGQVVRVYDPAAKETRIYDKNCVLNF